jgi:hypothetical protein
MKLKKYLVYACLWISLALASAGCQKASYPEDKLASAIQEICLKEYKIDHIEVKFSGRTIGVFLPLKKLFAADVRQGLFSGQMDNLDSLFEPAPEAMDQLEDVLFTISRALLSTDKKIDFYVLEASDIELTGLQLSLTGYVDDIRRVRLWDIPRSEYRKRILHELKLNRTVLWEQPVRELLAQTTKLSSDELGKRYFAAAPTPEIASSLFYGFLTTLDQKQNVKIHMDEIKSRPYRSEQAVVYVKMTETYEPNPGVSHDIFPYPSGTTLEYLFVVQPFDQKFKIVQILPLYFMDEAGHLKKIVLPPELGIDQDPNSWSERFSVEDIQVGDFLAQQLNRRVQALLSGDERIRHTIRQARINFQYQDTPEELGARQERPYFALYFDLLSKEMTKPVVSMDQLVQDEDALFMFDLILREFTFVMRTYRFNDYTHLDLVLQTSGSSSILKLNPDRLNLFREKKLNISSLFESPSRPLF